MAAITNTSNFDLDSVVAGGQVHEDVLDRINDISPEDLPFQDMIEKGTSSNHYKEFVEEQLEAANPDNASIDGEDVEGDDSQTGQRKGNYHQTSVKRVVVSDRARNVNTIGAADDLVKQVSKRQRALRRDVEARLTSNKPAVIGNDTDTASECAGIGAWIGGSSPDVGNSARGATGTDPTLSATTGGYPDAGPGVGTKAALTETNLKAMIRVAYKEGGNLRYAMSVPEVIEVMSDWMFSSSARVATLQSDAPQSNREGVTGGNGSAAGGITAQAAVNMYISNFGTVTFVPNRFQPESAAGAADLFLIDPDLWELSYLQGYRIKKLGDTGLTTKRLISVDYTLCGLAERGNAVVADIDYATPMIA